MWARCGAYAARGRSRACLLGSSLNSGLRSEHGARSAHTETVQVQGGLAAIAGAVVTATATAIFLGNDSRPSVCEGRVDKESSLPTISRAEVAKHKTKADGGIWVTYGDGVYDITEFIENHPGGASRIVMAAGGRLEPFWKLYAVHMKPEVLDVLKELKIGYLPASDMEQAGAAADSDDPFAKDPERHPALRINSQRPFNAEPPAELLVDAGFITPNDLYYVRNHLPVPEVDPEKYRLHVELEANTNGGGKCVTLSLDDLRTKFPQTKVVTAIQCAGNRRKDMTDVKPVKGLGWSYAAVSNCEWTGVRLRDVLAYVGMDVDDPGRSNINHIQFEGLDRDMTTCYGSSIPVDKAADPRGDVILAFEMNGEPIPQDHGFPVRAVVPGVVGARNVKWLSKVIASSEESQNHWQQKDYKGFCPSVDWDTVDFSKSPAIQELPVNSAILSPCPGAVISPHDEELVVKGYALAGGGRSVVRVDVSADGGKTWKEASLKPTFQPLNRTWAWTLWEAKLPLPKEQDGNVKLVCKAVDAGYNVQPEEAGPIWNIRGVLSNSWHKVQVKIAEEE